MTGKPCDTCILIQNRIFSWRRAVNARSRDLDRFPTSDKQRLYNEARVQLAKWRNERALHNLTCRKT